MHQAVTAPSRAMDLRRAVAAVPVREALLRVADGPLAAVSREHFQLFPPRIIEWNRYDLPLSRWPAQLPPLRIVHLSDFHLRRRWPAALDLVTERLRNNPPDLLLLTGDFVDNKRNHRPAMPNVRRLIAGVASRFGCFAIHGNHDSYKIGRDLRGTGVTIMDGRREIAACGSASVEIIGLPGKHRRELSADFLRSLPPPAAGVPRIVLSHFPDHLRRTDGLGADLFFSGHTHGGQICMPGGTALMWHDALPRPFCRGAHRIGRTWLVVSRGLGYTGLPLRTFAAPEVVELRCTSATDGDDPAPPPRPRMP